MTSSDHARLDASGLVVVKEGFPRPRGVLDQN